MDFQKELVNLVPSHEYFIGIVSDGCVFDLKDLPETFLQAVT